MDNKPKMLYIQMEFCEGNTLKTLIDSKSADADTKWRIFCQVVEALVYIHSMGLIHRDLKPLNIFLDKNNKAKLGDFGLAVIEKPSLQMTDPCEQS